MRENFLHYIWKHKKFEITNLKTTENDRITLVSVGQHNHNSGPDFFNSQLYINDQLWAGNVEIHVRSSDWYVHNHEKDTNYDNVILHVVWEHDSDIFRKDKTCIPTLVLKPYISKSTISNYQNLFSKKQQWINCENNFSSVDDFVTSSWLERLYFERLERKSLEIQTLLEAYKNNWEAVLFKMLAKNFGLKVNGESFFSMANSFEYSVLRKSQKNLLHLESLFLGQAGLLNMDAQDSHFMELVKTYDFLKQKYTLSNTQVVPVQFFRLRPLNFPTIRLSQLANLYFKEQHLFSKVIEAKTLPEIYNLFQVFASTYWDTHYTFNKPSRSIKKGLTKSIIDLLIINTIIPMKFSFAKFHKRSIDESIVKLIQQIASEKNSVIDKFNQLKQVSNSALQSQALIQLKTEYCVKNNCLQCAIGSALLSKID